MGSVLLFMWGCLVKGNPEYVDGAGLADLREEGDMTVVPPMLPEVLLPREASFKMGTAPDGGGNANERPEYPVTVEAFYLEVFEVTVEAYGKCVAAGVCRAPDSGAYCNKSDKPSHPVNCVNWEDADAFCRWTKPRRLPTEEEWEYAARGTTKAEYPWGGLGPDGNLCWNQTGIGTCPVGGYRRTLLGSFNDNGIADLAGNVWEWTASEYVNYPMKKSCTKASISCVIRGGSWNHLDPVGVRTAYRNNVGTPVPRDDSIGFRCARTP